ncbi:group II intron reverse transcriptase/maturase [Pseudofrankia sp. DC12]|uniref:group II intron reverse transcriptase/maturase n=1 Tax=Pseudofrankia sp. DC12 TaxID=683315 RepID=UPI000B21097C|nr:group II intron reverse transcriptase/maturase [Pseudofrankia sp. DC12]
MSQPKPFDIDKRLFVEAFGRVRANKGAAGVDGTSIATFESRLKDNLYKTWNRMSSGTYFPSPLREVVIPKPEGGSRVLAVPTVADRVAQTVAVLVLDPRVEPMFHRDSYGYRPGRSPLDAVAAARTRCWKNDWVIDLDIRAFFDSVPWDKLMAAVHRHLDWDTRWVGLYVERWLRAPLVRADGTREERTRGCPQGSPVSPLLANIYLHYAFDTWMIREFPGVLFERFSDDVVVHCTSEQQARRVLADIRGRLAECGLELNESKTQVVYCADDGRRKPWDGPTGFDFLGYTFHARTVRRRDGALFVGFTPAISDRNAKRLRRQIRRWRLHRRTAGTLQDLAARINPLIRGWINYYGAFTPSRLAPTLRLIDAYLARWLQRKYRRFRRRWRRSLRFLAEVRRRDPGLFAHWQQPLAVGRTARAG